jgi:hypothetical protein
LYQTLAFPGGVMHNRDMNVPSPIVIVLAVFVLSVKGIALWYAGKNKQRNWFAALFILFLLLSPVLNLLGIIDLVYLFKFAKNPLTLDEIRSWVQNPKGKKK